MTVHFAHPRLPRPDGNWQLGPVAVVPIRLPPAAMPHMDWLSARWNLGLTSIAADFLVAATSGHYVLAQLTSNGLLPEQSTRVPGTDLLDLCLLPETVRQLTLFAAARRLLLAEAGGQLVQGHLRGQRSHAAPGDQGPVDGAAADQGDDASMTLWLPEGLLNRVDRLAEYKEMTKSDVIRNTLMLRVVGRTRFEELTQEGSWRPKRKATEADRGAYIDGEVRFSRSRDVQRPSALSSPQPALGRRTDFIRQHGKSEGGTRVFLPAWLKRELEMLATLTGLPASEYCRGELAKLI